MRYNSLIFRLPNRMYMLWFFLVLCVIDMYIKYFNITNFLSRIKCHFSDPYEIGFTDPIEYVPNLRLVFFSFKYGHFGS